MLQEIGDFNETYRISADYEWLLRLKARSDIKICFSSVVSVAMSVGGISTQKKFFAQKLSEDLRILKQCFGWSAFAWWAVKVFCKFDQLLIHETQVLRKTYEKYLILNVFVH